MVNKSLFFSLSTTATNTDPAQYVSNKEQVQKRLIFTVHRFAVVPKFVVGWSLGSDRFVVASRKTRQSDARRLFQAASNVTRL